MPFAPKASPWAGPVALAATGAALGGALHAGVLSQSDALSRKGLVAGASSFFLTYATLRKILPRSKTSGMQVTAMEETMGRNQLFPPECKIPQNCSIINSCIFFRDCPSVDEIAVHWQRAVNAHKRLRAVFQGTKWELAETNVKDYITCHRADTEEAAKALVMDIANTHELPIWRPLWKIEVVQVPAPGRSIVMVRIHHAIGDGIGLYEGVLPMFATDIQGNPLDCASPKMPTGPAGFVANALWYLDSIRSFMKVVGSSAYALETDLPFCNPQREQLVYSGKREVAFFPPMSLNFIKKVKAAARCTVNDLMVTAWTGAVRRHSEARGFSFDKPVLLRALLPVVIPRTFPKGHDPEDRLCNNFTAVPVLFDPNPTDLKERLLANKKCMDVVKKTTIAMVGLWLLNSFSPNLPVATQQDTSMKVFARHSVMFSNVPGPKVACRCFGKPADEIQPFFLNAIPQVIAISCGDNIYMNLTADPDVVKPLQGFPQLYLEEIDALGKAFGVEGTCRM